MQLLVAVLPDDAVVVYFGADGRVAEIILGTEYGGTYVVSARPTRFQSGRKTMVKGAQ